ncbi:MAG: sigma-70 family RNA polymerase sigma factor [Alphaproteobacteria bacterium]|nr:sigma-70 family RNA polymerase sigma factor [Alphaproteobacteria bacterium]
MLSTIHLSDLQVLLREADVASRRYGSRLGISSQDRDDLRQDLLANLFARLPAFDPTRGSLGAFAATIFAHRAHRLGQVLARQRRLFGRIPLSLDDPAPGMPGLTCGDLIAEGNGDPATGTTELRVDLERVLAAMPAQARDIIDRLANHSSRQIRSDIQISHGGFYRQLSRIRRDLRMRGL